MAIKLVKPDIAADKNTIERFKNELKLARDIAHKNVCRMYDLHEESGTRYITMEYVSGGDLKKFIRRSKQLGVSTALSIAKQICAGLAEAHSLGIVHRDLKPNNIMIDDNGNPRIMDFGIARSISAKGITGKGVMIGTPEYMSPEQVEGKETDPRSDIYSLGVILYEMVTGRVPFEGDTPFTIGVKHKSEQPKDPKIFNARIPDGLNSVILKCLEKERSGRYQNAGDLSFELDKIEQGLPTTEQVVPTQKPITSKEITVHLTPKKLLIPVAAVLILAVVAFLVFKKPSQKLDPNRIVVAVFENQTSDSSQDQVRLNASSYLTRELSKIDIIDVVPEDAVDHLSSLVKREKERMNGLSMSRFLARETGAGTVVSGFYRLFEGSLEFSIEILEGKSGELIESLPPISGSLENPRNLIGNICGITIGALVPKFDEDYMLPDITPPNYEAYSEFVQGMRPFNNTTSLDHFRKAIDLDPEFVLPRVGLAMIYGNQRKWSEVEEIIDYLDQRRSELSPWELMWVDYHTARFEFDLEKLLQILQQLYRLSPLTMEVNFLLGQYAYMMNRYELAVEIKSKIEPEHYEDYFKQGYWPIMWYQQFATAYHMLGKYNQELKVANGLSKFFPNSSYPIEARVYAAQGKTDKGYEIFEKLIALPLDTAHLAMLSIPLELRERGHLNAYRDIIGRIVDWARENIIGEESTGTERDQFAEILYTAERWDEAQTEYEKLAEEFPGNIKYLGRLGTLAARFGNREKAQRISEDLKNSDFPYLRRENTYWRARIAAILGEKDLALKLLRESGRAYSYYIYRNMDFESVLDYPPFRDLLKPIK